MATKSPCEKCGKEITDIAHIRKRHVDNCKGADMSTAVVEPKIETPIVEKKVKEVTGATDDIKRLIEIAERNEAEYSRAPEAYVINSSEDEHMELRKIYAPETINKYDPGGKLLKKAKRSAYIADKNALELAAQRGYVPKLNEAGEFVRTQHGDVLTTISAERADAMQAASAMESEGIMAGHEKSAGVKDDSDMADVKTEIATRTQLGD